MLDSEKEIILKQQLSIDLDKFNELPEDEKRKVILQFKQEKTMYWQLIAAQVSIGLVVASVAIAFIFWAFVEHH
jgi:hypothetical protein